MMRVVEVYPCTLGLPGSGSFCGWCYENFRGRANHKGHRSYSGKPKAKYIDWSTMFKKVVLPGSVPTEGFVCSDDKFLKDFPTLAQGMCDPWGSDEKPRALWSLSIKMDGASVQVTISDKSLRASSYTNAPTLHQALRLANSAAEANTLTWRKWGQDKGR
jgi:hypothetical protein